MMINKKKDLRKMYDEIGLDMALFGISSECPYDGRKVCNIKKIKALKQLDLAGRYRSIKAMTDDEKKDLIEKTIDCAERCKYEAEKQKE